MRPQDQGPRSCTHRRKPCCRPVSVTYALGGTSGILGFAYYLCVTSLFRLGPFPEILGNLGSFLFGADESQLTNATRSTPFDGGLCLRLGTTDFVCASGDGARPIPSAARKSVVPAGGSYPPYRFRWKHQFTKNTPPHQNLWVNSGSERAPRL